MKKCTAWTVAAMAAGAAAAAGAVAWMLKKGILRVELHSLDECCCDDAVFDCCCGEPASGEHPDSAEGPGCCCGDGRPGEPDSGHTGE